MQSIMDIENFSRLCKVPNVEMMRIYYEDYKNSIDLNHVNNGKTTYLMISASNGLFENVRYLLRCGADPNITNCMRYTAMMCAVHMRGLTKKEDYLKIVKILLKYGSDINHQNNLGESALELAVKTNDADMVDLLLENGANLNLTNPSTLLSPQDIAIKMNNQNVIHSIVKHQGDRKVNGDTKSVVRNLLDTFVNS